MDAVTTTKNGAATYGSSDDVHIDFFFRTVRSLPEMDFLKLFRGALVAGHIDATVLLFHIRDARYGKGEIRMFKWALRDMGRHSGVHPVANAVMRYIPDYGCWHDLLAFAWTPLQPQMVKLFAEQLRRDDAAVSADKHARVSLAAKWAPREGKKHHMVARAIIAELGIGAAEYRKMLRRLCERIGVVEMLLSEKKYAFVAFAHVPAKAMHRYDGTFKKNASDAYAAYLQRVREGRAQMKVSQMEPHTILRPYMYGTPAVNDTVEVAWSEYVRNCQSKYPHLQGFLPVIDVSGSMAGTPLEVAVTLGMLLAECNKGQFHRKWVTFSQRPEFGDIGDGTVLAKVQSIRSGSWGMNTDINAVTTLLISSARMWNLQRDQLPHTIVIFSDMEFDAATDGKTNYEQIRADYAAAGMEMPKIVFWNLTASKSTPVKYNDDNCALISGFSPALFNLFVQVGEINPSVIMRQVLRDQRYDLVRNAVARIGAQ